jgi:hypothetical protein
MENASVRKDTLMIHHLKIAKSVIFLVKLVHNSEKINVIVVMKITIDRQMEINAFAYPLILKFRNNQIVQVRLLIVITIQ